MTKRTQKPSAFNNPGRIYKPENNKFNDSIREEKEVNLKKNNIDFNPDSSFSHLTTGNTIQRLPYEDPIHQPLLEDYRRTMGSPPGGMDESGNPVGPTDAELKYSGILASSGYTRWLPPVINRRNFAEVAFRSRGFSGTGGLTTLFINSNEIHSNLDVLNAIPEPDIAHRQEGSNTLCWFTHGINATGHSKMDIFTNGPWNFVAPRNEVASKYSWKSSCTTGTGPATIHINARPNDAAMEKFVRDGEAEHNLDMERLFTRNIGAYVADVNRLVSDRPGTRMTGTDVPDCSAKLRSLENRSILTQFVHNLNAATDVRHTNGRHGIAHTGITFNPGCTRIVERMEAGTL